MPEYWKSFSQKNIRDNAKSLKKLPITHNTDYVKFENIQKDKAFRNLHCDQFYGEERVFFYYGVPAYYMKDEDLTPSIFIFDVKSDELWNELDWVFMDSGTLNLLREKSIFNIFSTFSLEQLKEKYILPKRRELKSKDEDNSIHFIKSHIKYFFGNNSNYYDGLIDIAKKIELPSNISTISTENYYKTTKDFSYDYLRIKLPDDYKKIDKRDRIIEGSSHLPLNFYNLACIACYIPDHAKENIMSFFDLKEDKVKTYNSKYQSLGLSKDKIIGMGVDWIKNVLKDRLIDE